MAEIYKGNRPLFKKYNYFTSEAKIEEWLKILND